MDRGLHYGDGVFETINCREGGLQFWDEHMRRMHYGTSRLNINFSGEDLFYSDIQSILSELSSKSCIIKLIQTRGQGERGYKYPAAQGVSRMVMIDDASGAAKQHTSMELRYCKHNISINPSLAGIKHLNRLDNVLARNEWGNEVQEGLMLDMNDHIIEGTMSNVFGIKNGMLYTPDLSICGVKGIIRDQLLCIARQKSIQVHVNSITKSDMSAMDEVFVTNSIIGICSVHKIEQTEYKIGTITRMFIKELTTLMETHAKNAI